MTAGHAPVTAPAPEASDRLVVREPEEDLAADIDLETLPGYDPRLSRTGLVGMARAAPRTLGAVLALSWRAARWPTALLLAAQLVAGLMTASGLFSTTGALAALLGTGAVTERLVAAWPSVAVVVATLVLHGLADTVSAQAQARLIPRVRRCAERDLREATVGVRLSAYDDPDWHEMLARSRDRAVSTLEIAITQLVELTGAVVGLVAVAGVLGGLHPVLLVLLVVSVLPQARAALRAARIGYDGMFRLARLRRRQLVLADLLADRDAAAEIRACTAQEALLARVDRVAAAAQDEEQRVEVSQATGLAVGRGVSGLAAGITFAALVVLLQLGQIPLAVAGTALLGLSASRQSLARVVLALNRLHEYGMYLDDMRRFLATSRERGLRRTGVAAPAGFDRIRLERVSFRYPGADRDAVADVSLTLRRGEVVALVGENGSGKSTLARLLAGLYRPATGSVSWDGVDLSGVDEASVHDRIALIGQQAVRWPLSAAENIGIGRPGRDDPDGSAVAAAARRAGVHELVAELPQGYATMLSRHFVGGAELSGGQWQGLAIARGVYRDAALLLCDEPTSALDPRAEHRLHESLSELAADGRRTVVLITHRLSGVRMADRIVVLRRGRVVEQGPHDDLVRAGGLYQELWTLQASGYGGTAG